MNKRLYRIVFNKARGMLMVVSELARGCSGRAPSSGIRHNHSQIICRLGAISLSLWLASGALTVQAAGIVADKSAPNKQQPTIISTANGTPQVNIQTPSAGGVSRNTYSQFDVGQNGVILNNSHKNTATQLGGMVSANPWLAKGEAKIILNEVNARDPSRLNGFIEVAGQKADVVIASPSGITCDGCGFINAGRATLTTGTAQMQNGQITGYQVEQGEIHINGNGLDSTGQNHTDVIGRAVKVNAAIHAQDLRVTTGRNSVDAAHEQVTALADNGTPKPSLALDVAQVGGMYAGKIRLRGTEKGVGVRNAGNIGAEAGMITLSADGHIENSGAIWSSADVALSGTAAVQNSGSIAAQRNVSLTGNTIASIGTLAAGVQPDGTLGSDGDMTLNASGKLELHGLSAAGGNVNASGQGLDATGSLTQAKNITLNAGPGDISTASAQVIANDQLRITTSGTHDNSSGLLAADTVTLAAKKLQNQKGQISQSGTQTLELSHRDGIDNRDGTIAANAAITVKAATLDNRKGQILAADAGSLSVQTTAVADNRGGILAAAENVDVTADQLLNDGGLISADKGHVSLASIKPITNVSGQIVARTTLSLESDTLNNDSGLIQSGSTMRINTNGNTISNKDTLTTGGIVSFGELDVLASAIDNQHGMLASEATLHLNALSVDNRFGTVSAGESMTLDLTDVLNNRNGTVSAAGSLTALAGALENTQGTLVSGDDARIESAQIINQGGIVTAQRDLTLTAQRLDNNNGGLVQSGGNLTLNVDRISNRESGDAGGIVSQGNITILAADVQNDAGVVLATKQATLDTIRFSNIAGTLVALDVLTLATRSDTDNHQGVMQGKGIFLDTHGYQLDNQQGTLYSLASMQLATASLNNQNGTIGAKSDITLHAASLDNRAGGRVVSEQAMALNLERLDNHEGEIQSLGNLVVNAVSGVIDNTLGLMRSGATLTLNAASLINQNTQAAGKGIEGLDVAIASQQLDNAQGTVISGDTLQIARVETLNNAQGELSAAGTLSLSGAALRLINTDGVVIGGESVTLETNSLTGDGQILSLGDMMVRTQQNFDNSGDVIANGNMTFTTPGSVTNSGNLLAGAKLDLSAASLLNTASGEIAAGATWVTVSSSLSNYGLIDGSQTWLKADTLTNVGTGRLYGDHLSLQATTLNNLAQDGTAATLAGRLRVDIGAKTINNRDHALIYSDGVLAIGGRVDENGFATGQAQTLNNHSATIESAGDMALSVSQLNNINDHFSTEVALISTEQIHEYQHKGSPTRWSADEEGVFVDNNSADDLLNLNTPEDTGANNDNFYEYNYTRTIEEEVIAESEPGKILSGGQMVISANHVLNDKSQIVAGGAGIAFGKAHQLVPGVALTAEQMSLLTEDMVWLVNTRVQLADGSWQTVMVPQVYVRVQPGDVDGAGALMGGQNLVMNLNRDLVNSGTLHGKERVQLSADSLTNRAGTIQGTDVSLLARTDINNIGGTISGNHSVLATAGRDINLTTTTRSVERTVGKNSFERTTLERVAGIYVQGDDGKLVLSAGRDLNLTGAQVVNSGSESQTVLNAGRDLNLTTVTTSASDNLTWDKNNWLKQSTTQQVGSEVAGGGDVLMMAGRDVNAQAATVEAGSSLAVTAGRDMSITAAIDSSEFESHHQSTGSSGAFSKKTVTTHDVVNSETARGSLFSGDSVTLQAGHDLRVQGSDIVGDNDVRLAAGNNLTVTSAEEHGQESHQRQEKKSGLSGTGGIGISYGSQSLKVTDNAQEVTHRGSTIGSINGNVSLSAGHDLAVHGSDLIAGQDMTLAGKNVSITAATDSSAQTHSVEQKSSGLTLALSGTAGSALNTSVSTLKQARETDNDRLAALQAVKGALTAGQGAQAVFADQATGNQAGNDNTVGISLSYGSQSSTSTQTMKETTAKGSSLFAGNNLSLVATDGDVLVQGSQLEAGNDLLLQASRDVNLISAQNTSTLEGKNESHGSSAGIGIGFGSGGAGINVSASVNAGKGKENGTTLTHTETTVNAGDTLTIVSGRDTNLTGAQVSGESVLADIGRNLTITSEQDTDHYDSSQKNISAGGSFSFGTMTGSGGISYSRDKMDSNFASVREQSGIVAGSGGFDVTVGGGVMASTATADKNRLDTGTLGWRDIHNTAEYNVEHQSAGISTGGSIAGQFAGNMANGMLSGAGSSGSAEGITRAAVENGTVIVRDKANQTQDTAALSRDTANANGSIDAIFDKEKEQRRLDEAQLISDIGSQVSDIARTQGELNGDAQSGTGSDIQRAIQAATAAAQGIAGGDISAALAGAAAPYVAEIIGHRSGLDDGMEKATAHAVASAVLAAVQGKDALAGAAGAAAGELAGTLALEMYGKDVTALSESEKQTISALATLAAGIAGGLTGDSTASAVAGAQTGKTTVENNTLSDIAEQLATGESPADKLDKLNKAEEERFRREECAGLSSDACGAKMYDQRREALKDMASLGVDFVPVVGDIKGFAEAESAIDYLAAIIAIMPGGELVGKSLKAAEKALAKGDLESASRLINKASDDIQVKWVDENAGMSQRARDYNDSATGARSNIDTQKGQAPTIDRIDANGNSKPVRFDGVDDNVMIDRKISVVTTQKAKNQALRQSEALKNSGMTGRWEVPNQTQANRAQKMFDELGIKNIEVKIVKE